MNIFKKLYYRAYQMVFKIALPFLPYREPKILEDEDDIVNVLKGKGYSKAILITDKGIRGLGLTKELEQKMQENSLTLSVFDDVVPNPSTKNVLSAYEMFKTNGCEAIIAFGGGSAMDCAKAMGAKAAKPKKDLIDFRGVLKVNKKIPLLIAVPTTAGTGSETTLAAVISDKEKGLKFTINDFSLIPSYAMLKAELTMGLPKHITSTTGMDALTHAVEAYIGKSTTRQTRRCALNATKLVFENILEAYNNGSNLEARKNMLKAAYDAGLAFTKSYVGYIHAVAHTLGGEYNTPHGLANAVIMPYVLKLYGKKIHKKLWKMGMYAGLFDKSVSKADGARIFIGKIEELNSKMNIPTSIPEIKEEDIKELAKKAVKEANPLYPVPKLMSAEELEKIYSLVKNG